MSRVFLPLLFLAACAGDRANDDVITSQCPEETELFEAQVWPTLDTHCTGCHLEGGIASDSAFTLSREDMLANLRAVSAVSDRILLKPTGLHPDGHGGGEVIDVEGEAYTALSFWVDWTEGDCEVPEPFHCEEEVLPRRLRRLTHTEYARSVEDLLGIAPGADGFAADPEVEGFRNDAEALVVHGLLADQYRQSAESIADTASLEPGCSATESEAACAQRWIEDFGFRAFRRPLADDELATYQDFWSEVAAEDGLDAGLRWVVTAILTSPHFLYRSELGVETADGSYTLTDWEIATALAYSFWGTTPDAPLLAAAEAGFDDASLQAQVDRLATDPRTLETTADLVEVWLLLDRLQTASREGLTEDLRAAMAWETRMLVKDIASEEGELGDLLHARHTFVDDTLADHYGLSDTGRVELDGERYGGLLRQGSLLTAHARPTGSSPVHRGVLVRERLLCEELPPPPANLDTSPPPVDPSLSTRERYEEHSSDPACASCHDKIDPLGFGFEHYDGLGRWRADDAGHPIDDSGHLDGEPYVGLTELSGALEADPRFGSCFVQTWKRYATGAEACGEDLGTVGLTEPLIDIVSTPDFTLRLGESGLGDTLAIGRRPQLDEPPGVETPAPEAFALTIVDDWGSGFCADGVVTNTTEDDWTWRVREALGATVTNIWNATATVDGVDTVFEGVAYNATLAPGGTASFGFCAER